MLRVRDASDEQIARALGRRRRPEARLHARQPGERARLRQGRRSRATCSRSSCSSSARRPGAGRRSSPASGCSRTSSPSPGCASRAVDPESGARPLLRAGHAAVPAVPGHARRRARGARRALDRAAVALRRQHGHEAPQPRHDALPAGRRRGRALLARRHPRCPGRRRGLRDGDRDGDGGRPCGSPFAATSASTRRSTTCRPAARRARAVELPRLYRNRARPDGGDEGLGARDDRPARRPPRPRPARGLRGRQRRLRPAHPRGRRCAELGRRLLRSRESIFTGGE